MKSRATAILCVIAVLVLGGAWLFGVQRTPAMTETIATGRLAFPDLAARLQDAARVELTHAGKTLTIARKNGQWVSLAADGYPVQVDKLRGLLTGLTELRLMEKRTDDPALLAKLGLDDPSKPGSTATLLRVLDAKGKPIAELILGHQQFSAGGDLPGQVYVRRQGQNQSWLAEGRVQADTEAANWLDRDIANIPGADVVSVVATQGEAQLVLARKDGKPVVTEPAQHPALDHFKLDDVFNAYENLGFTDVKPATPAGQTEIGHSVFATKDGLKVTVAVAKVGDSFWARFSAAGDGKAKAQAEALNAKTKGWSYQLAAWKEQALVPTLNSLKSSTTTAPAAASAAKPAQ